MSEISSCLSCLLRGFALTFNWSYLPVQICGSDTCPVLERIEEEAEETRGSDLGSQPSRSRRPPSCQRMGMFGPKHRLHLVH